MRNIKGVVITIAFLVIGVVCRSQTLEKIFTIDQAVDRVMQNYPSIEQAEEAIKRAEYNVHMAQAAYYPSISGSAGYEWVSPKERDRKSTLMNSSHIQKSRMPSSA